VKAATLLALLALGAASDVHANISAPWQDGEPAGEPSGELTDLEVLSERIELDLRPLASASAMPVKVRYQIRNQGPAGTRRLVFVTPGLERGEIRLDGKLLPRAAMKREKIPRKWIEAARTPAIDGDDTLPYSFAEEANVIVFSLPLGAAATHELQIAYHLAPAWYDTGVPYVSHQVGYLLEPARRFGRFGTLQLEVHLPGGWEAASVPRLRREGDRLSGRFDGVPADFLGITARRPLEYRWGWVLVALGLAIGLAGGLWLTVRLGRATGKRGAGLALLLGLASSLLAVVLLFVLGVGGQVLWQLLLDQSQMSGRYFYDGSMALMLLGPVVALVYGVVLLVLFFRVRARARLLA